MIQLRSSLSPLHIRSKVHPHRPQGLQNVQLALADGKVTVGGYRPISTETQTWCGLQLRCASCFPSNSCACSGSIRITLTSSPSSLRSISWPAVLVARLLVGLTVTEPQAANRALTFELWEVWKAAEDRQHQLRKTSWSSRFGPEAGGHTSLESFRGKGWPRDEVAVRFIQSVPDAWSDEQLLVHLIARNVTHKGTDVRLDLQAPLVASDFCRRSLDRTLGQWKVVMSHKWRHPGHIFLKQSQFWTF